MNRTAAWGCVTITFMLLVSGAALYWAGLVGWAQCMWVLASGTTGAAAALFIDGYSIGMKDDE